jgi:tRNA threonylcarbamoyl adenosine modification protein (Sua5/YciO/YrdC/YwlC family)
MPLRIDVGSRPGPDRTRGVTAAAAAARRGELLVFPTESMYAVAADPFSPRGITSLREVKGRGSSLPVPVLVGAIRTVDGLATGISAEGRALIEAAWPGPLTLVVRAQPTLAWDLGGSTGTISVRMPLHPVALEVLAATGPLAATGAQRSGSTPPRSCDEAEQHLGDDVSVYLDGGPAPAELPSTIVDLSGPIPALLREGGFPAEVLREVCPDLLDSTS